MIEKGIRRRKVEGTGVRTKRKEERKVDSRVTLGSPLPIFSKSINGFCQRHMEEAD